MIPLSLTNCHARALNFIAIMLEELVKTKDEVSVCASRAYDQTLRNYHGFIVRGVFSVSLINYYYCNYYCITSIQVYIDT